MTPDERNAINYPQAIHHDPEMLAWFTAPRVRAMVRTPTRYERMALWLRRVTAWRHMSGSPWRFWL